MEWRFKQAVVDNDELAVLFVSNEEHVPPEQVNKSRFLTHLKNGLKKPQQAEFEDEHAVRVVMTSVIELCERDYPNVQAWAAAPSSSVNRPMLQDFVEELATKLDVEVFRLLRTKSVLKSSYYKGKKVSGMQASVSKLTLCRPLNVTLGQST